MPAVNQKSSSQHHPQRKDCHPRSAISFKKKKIYKTNTKDTPTHKITKKWSKIQIYHFARILLKVLMNILPERNFYQEASRYISRNQKQIYSFHYYLISKFRTNQEIVIGLLGLELARRIWNQNTLNIQKRNEIELGQDLVDDQMKQIGYNIILDDFQSIGEMDYMSRMMMADKNPEQSQEEFQSYTLGMVYNSNQCQQFCVWQDDCCHDMIECQYEQTEFQQIEIL